MSVEIVGKLNSISIDFASGKPVVSFIAEDKYVLRHIEQMRDKLLRVDVRPFRKKRSLDQNSYYWTLVGQLAEALNVSRPYMHNHLLRSYGQLARHNDKLIDHIIKDDMSDYYDEAENIHLYPTSHTTTMENGEVYRLFYELKGSKDLDTKEMTSLLEGTIEECKAQGIQTITPNELARMRAAG